MASYSSMKNAIKNFIIRKDRGIVAALAGGAGVCVVNKDISGFISLFILALVLGVLADYID